MKKVILLFLFSLNICYSFSQELPHLKNIKLNKKSHFKGTETLVFKVTDYLFQTPIDKKNKSRTEAGQFLLKWMNGTPYYTFYLEEKETNFFNTDSDLMLMYMAGLTKFTLDNPSIKDQKTLILGTMGIVLPYLNKQENKTNWSKELWQLNDANQKGKLQEYLYQDFKIN
ncbi:hypothetical protein EZ428_20980 [Pedobacter frigiditerrae]|uniref:DUF2490 domain-containing protein n=1 Tax=Pedobacter frigiditerrae TaxID=2530452 RepID=A0A4R0MN52_9SPHI|nr:hypothetical protein [Pedobacter frigiditerrae]TCC88199.1 hypothetical protein EZ428_20980 [Pedobacter frigiditerrae]